MEALPQQLVIQAWLILDIDGTDPNTKALYEDEVRKWNVMAKLYAKYREIIGQPLEGGHQTFEQLAGPARPLAFSFLKFEALCDLRDQRRAEEDPDGPNSVGRDLSEYSIDKVGAQQREQSASAGADHPGSKP